MWKMSGCRTQRGSQLQNPAGVQRTGSMAPGLAGSRPWGRRGWVCAGRAGDRTPESGCSQRKGCQRAGRSACAGARGGSSWQSLSEARHGCRGDVLPSDFTGPSSLPTRRSGLPAPLHLTPAGRGRTCRAHTPRRVPSGRDPRSTAGVLITVEGSGVAVSAAGEAGSGGTRHGEVAVGRAAPATTAASPLPSPKGPWVLEHGPVVATCDSATDHVPSSRAPWGLGAGGAKLPRVEGGEGSALQRVWRVGGRQTGIQAPDETRVIRKPWGRTTRSRGRAGPRQTVSQDEGRAVGVSPESAGLDPRCRPGLLSACADCGACVS